MEPLARVDRQLVSGGDLLPELDELFLLVGGAPEPAVEGQLHRLGHDQLAARVLGDGAADLVLLQGDEAKAVPPGRQGTGQARRAGADDQQVQGLGLRVVLEGHGCLRQQPTAVVNLAMAVVRSTLGPCVRWPADPLGDLCCHRGAVGDGRAHQRIASDLAGQVEAGDAGGLQLVAQDRNVVPLGQVSQRDLDGAHRAGLGAAAVADTTGAVDHCGLAVDEAQDAVLRAGRDAGTTAHTAA